MYKGCIFDIDGTLYLKRGFGRRLILGNMGLYENVQAMQSVLKTLTGEDLKNGSQYKRRLFEGMAEELNRKYPAKPPVNAVTMGHWFHHEYYPALLRTLTAHYRTAPVCLSTLQALTKRYMLAVYSDIGIIDERLRAIGIPVTTFSYRISADETGELRPAPRAYRDIAAMMGIAPDEVLVIGDRVDIDGETASQAGMDFFRIGDRDRLAAFIESWERLSRILLPDTAGSIAIRE